MAFLPFFLYLSISLFITSTSADEIHGCGGFVQASTGLVKGWKSSDSKLDYSDITVELCTTDGLVKERTQCAPNGYYFIPVYDKGSFILRVKGPKGWSWDPKKVPVIVDQNGCNENADINFKFTGFMITGRVMGAVGGESCPLKNKGPSGVKIELLSPSGDLISDILTSQTGEYSFPNVIPGNYQLRAYHPDYEIETQNSPEVKLGFGNARVEDLFFISGYNIHGSIVAQGNPILGVNVYLYSDDVSNVNCPKDFATPPKSGALCHAISDEQGNFVFKSVPCGSYKLLPYYKGENTVFDVSPAFLAVSVEHNHFTVPQKFQVTGFSMGGRVIDDKGVGIENARVLLDGQFKAVTDNLGYYKLDQVTSKPYSIVAEKDHYKFSTLENFMILPNMASIEDIKAISYNLCGFVRMVNPKSKARVALTHGSGNTKPQSKLVDQSGWFCFNVPAGEYQLAAVPVVTSAISHTPVFSPPSLNVKVEGPVLNLEFSQTQVSIRGEVLCKEKCSQDISLTLVRAGGSLKERNIIILGDNGNKFSFPKVLPGKYTLEIKHGQDKWCWEKSNIDLDVGPEDMDGIIFTQKGYWVDIISTHSTDSYIELPDSSNLDFSIKKGPQRVCLESPGKHKLHFVNKCIRFEGSSLSFDSRSPKPLIVRAMKYLVTGEIQVDSDGQEINVDVLNKKDGSLLETIAATFISKKDDSSKSIYQYSIWATLGDNLVFVPKDSSKNKEKKILFYPTQQEFSVAKMECQEPVPQILGRPGLYIEGSVSSALSGVKIRIVATGQSRYAQLKENDVAAETETNSDGFYSAGPLFDDITYQIHASKSGYHVRKTGENTFACEKLGQIEIRIHGETDLEIPAVLLSLSGDNGYRNNTVSGTGGAFTFTDLFPGSFYLRPVLKEYSFSPKAHAIELESGESKVIDFHASRVAFSAMGSVKLLSGQPKEGVFIEARSETEGFYEEATTDTSGQFRLRGLVPDTTYLIRVVPKGKPGFVPIERSSPQSIPINVGNGDTKGLDFIVFEIPETPLVTGHVEGDELDTVQQHLSVEVRSVKEPSRVEMVISLPLSNFFEIRDLSKGKHLIQLRSNLPSSSYIFDSDVFEVDLDKQPQVHIGPLKFRLRERHHKQDVTPAPLLPLIVGVSVIIIFISMPRLNDFYQMAMGMANGGSSAVSSKKDAPRRIVSRKRA